MYKPKQNNDETCSAVLVPLLTWVNFNPGMDK